MKIVYLSLCLSVFNLLAHAQKPSIQWGDEFKLRKGSTDLRVVSVDKTGAYLQESHPALKSYFVVGATMRESASLVKVDNNLKEIYRNDFNKELKGKEFEQFVPFDDKLYLFSSDYSKRDRTLTVHASGIDKNTGELTGEWRLVATYVQDEKSDDINFKIAYNVDSSKLLVISSIEKSERNEYRIQELGKNLKAAGKPLIIKNQFEANKYQLEDVLYTIDRKVILVGRMYEYEEGKKKKEKFLDFTNYNIRIFNDKGKQETEINTTINAKWLVSTKLLQERNKDLILTAFYSNEKKGKTIDGLLVQRINVNDGKVISTSDKAINNSLLSGEQDNAGNDDADDKEESKEEKKMRDELSKLKNEGEGFSKHMQFRDIFYTPDNGLVILAEYFDHYTTTSTRYSGGSNGIPGSSSTTTYENFISKDLMMCKIDASGNISWLQILPKNQREIITYPGHSTYGSGISFSMSYFISGNMPYYSGFGAIQSGNTIHILLNDNSKNATVVQAGQKVKSTSRFGKTDCYVLDLDAASGKFNRTTFFSNKDVPTAMPRLGAVIGNDMYMVGKSDRMLGKTKIAVAKITIDK
ncbi:hypothetical protein DVR12_12315 [Chitinophaga silvatica]|uniref:Uncharacterized protein n=1 Tax=Chitinophaga silvatica TaxID=2282649 RepID=A0A3E1YA87_9BACT|nr:hypothetical protein [Chitinophaga silvatica]RFS22578.1 hypothetical protein DVR12_12315 [Chitinophaga silvatica]